MEKTSLTCSFRCPQIKFGTHVKSGSALIAQGGAYMSHLGDADVGCSLDCSYKTCCCAGLGCCRQKITGSDDSIAFLAAGGTIVYKHLADGETITVDTNSVVALEESVSLGITPNGKLGTCLCGGEGCFSTTLTGPGRVYLQVSENVPTWVLCGGQNCSSNRSGIISEFWIQKVPSCRPANGHGRTW
jgi:hypothetical protein